MKTEISLYIYKYMTREEKLTKRVASLGIMGTSWRSPLTPSTPQCVVRRYIVPEKSFRNLIKPTQNQIVLSFSDWFGSKLTSIWFQINLKMVNTIWFRFELTGFQKYFSRMAPAHCGNCSRRFCEVRRKKALQVMLQLLSIEYNFWKRGCLILLSSVYKNLFKNFKIKCENTVNIIMLCIQKPLENYSSHFLS